MSVERAVLEDGLAETAAALRRWNARPWPVLGEWAALSLAVAVGLLLAVWAVAGASTPDPSGLVLPGVTREATAGDMGRVLYRNGLVLALHAMACVAGFMAGSSLPRIAETRRGLSRRVHEHAGPLAIAFVVVATAFSLLTQTYALGRGAATLGAQLDLAPGVLLLGLLPHALPELVALFLPLAAWLSANRRGAWGELLAATVATVALAAPVLVASAIVEVYLSPQLLAALAGW